MKVLFQEKLLHVGYDCLKDQINVEGNRVDGLVNNINAILS